ncbi:hypothetical protein PSENEW3_00003384 [Picochlorum sp. SENEW3]|nr:hypothetical protein PSENEW3_00003384 [Picochlorum sp. SENEW3]
MKTFQQVNTAIRGPSLSVPMQQQRHGMCLLTIPRHMNRIHGNTIQTQAMADEDAKQYGFEDVKLRVQQMGQKYDFLSAFMGSIAVTGYFVFAKGQDVGLALSISSCSTIMAVVVNEYLFGGNETH